MWALQVPTHCLYFAVLKVNLAAPCSQALRLSGSQALRLLGMRKSALSGVPWSKDVSSWIMMDYVGLCILCRCIYDIIWITIILHMSQAAESSIHRDEYTHYKESTYGMTIPYIINYHVLAIADVASISGLFPKAFVSVLVSISIPEKISYSLLQSYAILWVSLEMGYTVYPQNCYLYRLAYWYTPKMGFLLVKSGEDDGSPMDLGKTKRCIVCMKNHRW